MGICKKGIHELHKRLDEYICNLVIIYSTQICPENYLSSFSSF